MVKDVLQHRPMLPDDEWNMALPILELEPVYLQAHHDWFGDPANGTVTTSMRRNMGRATYISDRLFDATSYDIDPAHVRVLDNWYSGCLDERYRANELAAGDIADMQLFWPDKIVDRLATKQRLNSLRICRKSARKGGWEHDLLTLSLEEVYNNVCKWMESSDPSVWRAKISDRAWDSDGVIKYNKIWERREKRKCVRSGDLLDGVDVEDDALAGMFQES